MPLGLFSRRTRVLRGQRLGREALPGGASGLHPLCGQSCLLAPSLSGIAASCTLFVGDRGVLHSLRLAASCSVPLSLSVKLAAYLLSIGRSARIKPSAQDG